MFYRCEDTLFTLAFIFSIQYERIEETTSSAGESEVDMSPSQILKTQTFYVLWLTFFLSSQATLFIASYYKVGFTFSSIFYFSLYDSNCLLLYCGTYDYLAIYIMTCERIFSDVKKNFLYLNRLATRPPISITYQK